MLKYLRIKKRWLLAIENGEKTVEYRAAIPHYEWLARTKAPFKICFHYQTDHRIIKQVDRVRLIKTPKSIPKEIISTEKCWAIYLS